MAEERVHSDSSKVAFDMSTTHAGEEENAPLDPLAVLTLLEKVAGIVDTVNETQQKMQQQQMEIESTVKMIQIDVARLHKAHLTTDTSVAKLLEKTRKINVNMKDVRQRLDRTNAEVKKVEGNHNELLKRNKFRVVIFQEENEIASSVAYKKLPKGSSAVVEEEHTATEHMPPPDLSSDEEYVYEENTTAARLKKTGKKQVDNIKKAFSRENMQKTRQNIGKQMNRLSTTIVPPEQREKIRISGERIKKSITDSKPFHIKKKNERSGAEGQEVAVRGIGESSKGEGVMCTEVVTAPGGAQVSQDHPQAAITNVANTETVVVTMESKNEEVVPATAEVKQNPEYS
ncbi:caveolae-associated protein 4a [Callorhinchus milii]|uniref:Muscle-restricted coiled-coil protein n=1 Tax=Callorhinchus milii TaxID=7868 RepID=V9L0P9_CALMI|nr:caveolae-associated protein 4a [Callorhinchus milii]|eukprot:gi/632959667/ref/XP_007895755.1/ PREDICTED: muscle-related coiled-coil protein [Callorhinchus milii]